MKYILSIDQGTTSSRAILFDRRGNPHAAAQQEFKQIFPQPGWVEHDPEAIWNSQYQVINEVLKQEQVDATEIAGIGIANQRETTLLWDRQTGQPIGNAIVWQDRRTAGICQQLQSAGLADTFRKKTGLVLDAYFSGTKLKWMLDHLPDARRRAEAGELAFGTVDSWLIWKLTAGKVHVTDATNASRTLMFDIHRGCWDDELLGLLDVPRSLLPTVCSSSEVCGTVAEPLLCAGVPIAGIAGDQHGALFGQMCTRPGMVKNTYGTGCFMLMHTGHEAVNSNHNLLTTVAWKIGDQIEYALEGSIFIAGAAVQWLRDGLGLFDSAAEIEALAASVPDNGGVYFVPAFTGLGTPHWDPHARGLIGGITRGSTKAHFARAALEGIAFQVADVLDAMHSDAGIKLSELRVDGGACANNLLMQIQADLLRVPVVRPKVQETTALGVAYLAGLATGFWPSREAIAEHWQMDRRFTAILSESKVRLLKSGWNRALERSKSWANEELDT